MNQDAKYCMTYPEAKAIAEAVGCLRMVDRVEVTPHIQDVWATLTIYFRSGRTHTCYTKPAVADAIEFDIDWVSRYSRRHDSSTAPKRGRKKV